MPVTLPEGYEAVGRRRVRAFARSDVAGRIEEALRGAGTLYAWAAATEGTTLLPGRGPVCSIPSPVERQARWAVRRYRRGGAMAPLLDDRHIRLGRPRPWRELAASLRVRGLGIPTPSVLAGAAYPAGAFYRADLVTEVAPGVDLARTLFADRRREQDPELLARTGRFVRLLERAGVRHADLNAGNLLVGAHAGELHLLDLDRCRILSGGTPVREGTLRRRLVRSLVRLGRSSGRPLAPDAWAAFERGWRTDP